ncbi:hypothetical protein AB6N23_00095 [Cellulomonas sp. 179-A 9B4 NHS]|uniref:hypothetical protein n=1 Tax=Cellulomonas sp. 179-A 9B4 NHS TaxID=3142379 RepID=UPI0039A05C3F
MKRVADLLGALVAGVFSGLLVAGAVWLAFAALFFFIGTMSGLTPYAPQPWLLLKIIVVVVAVPTAFGAYAERSTAVAPSPAPDVIVPPERLTASPAPPVDDVTSAEGCVDHCAPPSELPDSAPRTWLLGEGSEPAHLERASDLEFEDKYARARSASAPAGEGERAAPRRIAKRY